jgi:hypothetical protein
MAKTESRGDIYGDVNSLEDLRRINRQIRKEMNAVKKREELTELKKRSDYLCTLTLAPSWQERFGQKTRRLLEVAREEDRRTVEHANKVARRQGWAAEYHAWRGG